MEVRVWGLGLTFEGLRFIVSGLGFTDGVQGLRVWDQEFGFGFEMSGFGVQGRVFKVQVEAQVWD